MNPFASPSDPTGAAAYRGPEQLPGGDGPIGPASDLFSLGAILYEMLERELPYRAASTSKLRETMERLPAPTFARVPGHLPRELEGLLARTLTPRTGERFQNAGQAVEPLRALLRLVDPTPTVVPQPAAVPRSEPPQDSAPPSPAYRHRPPPPRMPWSPWLQERRLSLESQRPSLFILWVVPGLLLALLVAFVLWFVWR